MSHSDGGAVFPDAAADDSGSQRPYGEEGSNDSGQSHRVADFESTTDLKAFSVTVSFN